MTFIAAGAITAGLGLGYNVYKGIKQEHDASAINSANPRPTDNIPQEYYDNLNIANQMAQQGTPSAEYDNQKNAINQNTASAISAINNSANPGAGVTSVARQADQANANLNATSAQERANNLKLAMQYRGQLAQQKLAAQQYNSMDKYAENYNRAASLQTAANGNFGNALNGASGVLGALANNYSANNGQTMGQVHGTSNIDPTSLHQAPMLNTAMHNPQGIGQSNQPYGVKFNQWQPDVSPQPSYQGLPYTWGGQ